MDHAQGRALPDRQSAALVASAGNRPCQSHVVHAARGQPTKDSERRGRGAKCNDNESDVSVSNKSNPSSDASTEHQRIRENRSLPPSKHHGPAAKVEPRCDRSAVIQASEPVLVHADPTANRQKPQEQHKMRSTTGRNPERDPNQLPSLDSFTFHDIFASLDPEVKKSVDTIAEIYGRSKMSLADQHVNHLPPQANINLPVLEASPSDAAEETNNHRLEPVQEVPVPNRRSQCLSLAGASSHHQSELSTSPMAATSLAMTYRSFPPAIPNPPNTQLRDSIHSEDGHSSLSNIVTWLRHLNLKHGDLGLAPGTDNNTTASQSLRRVLGDA